MNKEQFNLIIASFNWKTEVKNVCYLVIIKKLSVYEAETRVYGKPKNICSPRVKQVRERFDLCRRVAEMNDEGVEL